MTNSVKFTIASTAGVEDIVLVQDAANPTTIHATINDSATVHDITGASASADGTQVKGYTRWWFFVTETVNLAISGTTVTMSISNYSNISGTVSAPAAAEMVNFVKMCNLPAIS
jgi:hypothetical protein